MVSRNMLAALLVLMVGSYGFANAQWETSLDALLDEVATCQPPVTDGNPCSQITSKAVKAVYGIDDFDDGGAMMPMSKIDEYVAGSSEWTMLGTADNQEALNKAQDAANAGKATLAILKEEPQGHVVIILPGKLTPSGKWGLSAPNSASFFLNVPRLSYVGKPMSYAFKVPGVVELYSRN